MRKTGASARKCRESEGELFSKTEGKCVKMLGKQRKICKTRQFPRGEDAYSKLLDAVPSMVNKFSAFINKKKDEKKAKEIIIED